VSADLTPRQRDMLSMVRALRSAGISEIAAAYDTTPERCVYVLRQLRKRGLVCVSSHNRGARWFTPENAQYAEAAHADRKEASRLAEQARKRRRQEQKTAYQRKYREEAAERWSQCMVQRIVPAREAPPLRVTAANSVWALGAAA
jgi:DNA-binding MarR family transcriptional regulator